MSTPEWRGRIQNRKDTAANWEAKDPVLLNGEIIVVETSAGEIRHKTGDGIKSYTQLPFDDEVVRNLIISKTDGKLASVFSAGTTAPSDTRLLWIDTGNSNVMKFYNGSAWVPVNFAWTT